VQQQEAATTGRKALPGGAPPIKPTYPLLGVLDLGGGSLQITFALTKGRKIPPKQAAPLQMPGLADRQVYSHSFEGWGVEVRRAGPWNLWVAVVPLPACEAATALVPEPV
jgi:hypothetical protein